MFKASSGVFVSLQTDLKASISDLQRINQRVNLYSTGVVLCLQVLAAGLPWYSQSLLKDESWKYVSLYGVCRGDWGEYCRLYVKLEEDCDVDCGEFEDNWKAGRLALGLLVTAVIGMAGAEINGLVIAKWPRCCSIQIWLQGAALLCSASGAAVWLSLSRYKRASTTEVQPGMTLALVSLILNTALVLHTAMITHTQWEFQAAEAANEPVA